MRAEGWKVIAIAAYFGKNCSTVSCALHPNLRERRRELNRKCWQSRSPEERAERNRRKRLAYARQQRKKWEEREKMLDTSAGGIKLAPDGAHQAPLNTEPEV